MGEKIRERLKNIDGSEEPLSEYKSDVIKEIDVEDLHYMQDNRQIQLATEGASRERKRATRQYIPRAIMREKCTTRLGWDSTQKPGTQQAYPALKHERKMHNESKGTGRWQYCPRLVGAWRLLGADVQIQSERN